MNKKIIKVLQECEEMINEFNSFNKDFQKFKEENNGYKKVFTPFEEFEYDDDDLENDFKSLSLNSNKVSKIQDFNVPEFNTVQERDKWFREKCEKIKIPEKYQRLWKQYSKIENIPQPEQRTQEWYDMRNNFITASAGAQAIGLCKYSKPDQLILDKIGYKQPFVENNNVFHGKKLETIATLIYEQIFNVKVGEFGLIPDISSDNNVDFLGASPDGICTCLRLDGKFSKKVGRMLEIKCVTSRTIKTSLPEYDYIVPKHYWIQIQLQLHCCDLKECDFWQCKILDFFNDVNHLMNYVKKYPDHHFYDDGVEYEVRKNLLTGVFIQLAPKDHLLEELELKPGEKPEFFSKFIYPTDINKDMDEKMKWAENMKENWESYYPDLVKDYKFDKFKYYYLSFSGCYLVKRDNNWYKKKLPEFRKFWDKVIELRNDEVKRENFVNLINKKSNEERKKINSIDYIHSMQ